MSGADVLKTLRTLSLRPVTVAGLSLHVRGLTGAERRLLAERAKDGHPMQAFEVVGLAACTEKGERLFTEDEAIELGNVDGAAVEQIAQAILEASGLMPKAQDDAAKN